MLSQYVGEIVFGGPRWKHVAVLLGLIACTYAMMQAQWGWPVLVGMGLAYCQGVITFVTLVGPIRLPKLPRWMCDCDCNHEH